MPAKTHGHRSERKRSRAYAAWVNMRSRCRNPNVKQFKDWGGRGISFDLRWESFEAFLADMGEPASGLSLDRLDNALGYSKSNCAWRTRAEQNLNKRNCVRYEFNGQTKTLAEWSRDLGIGRVTLLKRLQRGIPVERAFAASGYLCATRGAYRMPTNDQTTGLLRLS
jgi:hypothetical protein